MAATAALLYSNVRGIERTGFRQNWSEVWQVTGWTRPMDGDYAGLWSVDGLPIVGQSVQSAFANPVTHQNMDFFYVAAEPQTLDPEGIVNIIYTLQEDPLGLPLLVSQYTCHKTEAWWKDDEGFPIINSAGMIYMPPLTRTRAIVRLEVIKNIALSEWVGGDVTQYVDHVNANGFRVTWVDGNGVTQRTTTWGPGTVYLDEVRQPTVKEPYYHTQVTFIFLIDTLQDDTVVFSNATNPYGTNVGWVKRVPNMGTLFLDSNGDLTAMTDDHGQPTGMAGFLDVAGNKLTTGDDILFNIFPTILPASFGDLIGEFS